MNECRGRNLLIERTLRICESIKPPAIFGDGVIEAILETDRYRSGAAMSRLSYLR
jgi:hypothetical protein